MIKKMVKNSGWSFWMGPESSILKNIVFIGTGPRVKELIRKVNEGPQLAIKIIGIFDPDKNRVGHFIEDHKVIGIPDELPSLVRREIIDFVLVVVPRSLLDDIRPVLVSLERMGVYILFAIDEFNPSFVPAWQTEFLGMPFQIFGKKPYHPGSMAVKRLLDIVCSFVGIIVLSPLLILTFLLVRLTSRGPVFFIQQRVGLNGRTFALYKFRTMVPDAESRLKDLMNKNEMKGPAFKITNDPRLTLVGKFLRKFSIDELPQLINVLKGDMSLVGPRPPLPSEIKFYRDWHWRRLSVRPGITCYWQIMGRNRIVDFDEWAKLDLKYIDHWSLLTDLKILVMTVPVVLFAKGAK